MLTDEMLMEFCRSTCCAKLFLLYAILNLGSFVVASYQVCYFCILWILLLFNNYSSTFSENITIKLKKSEIFLLLSLKMSICIETIDNCPLIEHKAIICIFWQGLIEAKINSNILCLIVINLCTKIIRVIKKIVKNNKYLFIVYLYNVYLCFFAHIDYFI